MGHSIAFKPYMLFFNKKVILQFQLKRFVIVGRFLAKYILPFKNETLSYSKHKVKNKGTEIVSEFST